MFWVLTALCLSSLAQREEIKIIGTDTFATVKMQRLREANGKHVELNGCKQENDSLFSQVRTYMGSVNNLKASITDLKEVNKLNGTLLSDKQKLIDLKTQELAIEARRVKILRLERNSLAGAVAILLLKIAFFK